MVKIPKKKFYSALTIILLTITTPSLAQPQQPSTPTAPSHRHAQQSSTLPRIDVLKGPLFSMGAYGDTTLGFIAEAKLASYLSYNERDALALEFDGGPKVFRANVTYGIDLTSRQRAKLTYEYLRQNLDFDFKSGHTSRWVYQNAIGGAYAYLLDNRFIESLGFGGYFSQSPSKNISPGFDIDSTEYDRRIAGAKAGNVHADLALRLWPYSRLRGGIDYDIVHFNTKKRKTIRYFDDKYQFKTHRRDKNISGIGGHIQLEQRLFPQLKATLLTSLQQIQYEYMASIGWLLPSPAGMQFELEAITDYVDSRATAHNFFTNGARLNISFAPSPGVYKDVAKQQQQSILTWTREPAVRMATVLAIVDGDYVVPLTVSELKKGGQGQSLTDGSFYLEGWTIRHENNQVSNVNEIEYVDLVQFVGNDARVRYAAGGTSSSILVLQRRDLPGVIDNGDVWQLEGLTGHFNCNIGPAVTQPQNANQCRFLPPS